MVLGVRFDDRLGEATLVVEWVVDGGGVVVQVVGGGNGGAHGNVRSGVCDCVLLVKQQDPTVETRTIRPGNSAISLT